MPSPRTVRFSLTECTWMSLDVSPYGRTVASSRVPEGEDGRRSALGDGWAPAGYDVRTGQTQWFNIIYPGFAKLNATVRQRFNSPPEGHLSVDNLTSNQSYGFYNGSPVGVRTTMLGLHATL